MGVRLHNLDNDFFAFVSPGDAYLDTDRARCCRLFLALSYRDTRAKLTGLYITMPWPRPKQLIMVFDEAIMLTPSGYVAEGSGENIS